MGKLQKLEAIRGFVALYVLFHHISMCYEFRFGQFNTIKIFGYGTEAVMIFFILSGFVIELSHRRSKDKSFKLFFCKRFFRLYIPLLLVFVINYLVYSYQNTELVHADIKSLILNLLMLQEAYLFSPNEMQAGPFLDNVPLWSLAFEWWFYMIFFFVKKWSPKYSSEIVFTLAIIAAISFCLYPIFISKLFAYLLIWWIGVECARLYDTEKKISFANLKKPLVVLFTIIFILWMFKEPHFFNISKYNFFPFFYRCFKGAAVVIITAILWHKLKWIGFKYTIGLFLPFARISYTIYITHWFLICRATYFSFIENVFLRNTMYILVCLIVSYLIECIIYPKANKFFMSTIFPKPKLEEATLHTNK